jgi:hypothetical protein
LTVREALRRADRVIGAPLADRKLGGLRPWAWGPDSVELFNPLFASVTANQRPAESCFNDRIAALYTKAWSAGFLRRFLLSLSSRRGEEAESRALQNPPPDVGGDHDDWLCSEMEVGVTVNSTAAALDAIAAIRSRGHHKVVLKESIGVAGSNALRLFEPELTENQKRWIANVIASGREIVVEPWLERELDFSVQLEMTPAGLKLIGYTGLLNDAKGQFIGNWAEPKFERKLPSTLTSLLGVVPAAGNPVHRLFEEILAALELALRAVDFLGPLGIDAFVYCDANGVRRLKPIVEINPRYTMGRVTVELMARAAQGSHGWFRLFNRASLRDEGCEDFASLSQQLHEKFPVQFSNDPARRIAEGAVCLNDPQLAQVCLAVFQVFRCAADLQRCVGLASGAFVKDSR